MTRPVKVDHLQWWSQIFWSDQTDMPISFEFQLKFLEFWVEWKVLIIRFQEWDKYNLKNCGTSLLTESLWSFLEKSGVTLLAGYHCLCVCRRCLTDWSSDWLLSLSSLVWLTDYVKEFESHLEVYKYPPRTIPLSNNWLSQSRVCTQIPVQKFCSSKNMVH